MTNAEIVKGIKCCLLIDYNCDKCTNTSPTPNFGDDNTKTYYKVIGNEQQLNIYIPYNIKAKNTKINMCMSTAIPIKYCPWCGRKLKKE